MSHHEKLIVERFNEASATYTQVATLQKEVGSKLIRLVDFTITEPKMYRWLDIGCGPASVWETNTALRQDRIQLWGLDLSYQMLSQIKVKQANCVWLNADMNRIPLRDESMDVILSSFALHWSRNWRGSFEEIFRVLAPSGYFAFAFPISGSFSELENSWQGVDHSPHIHEFPCQYQVSEFFDLLPVSILSWRKSKETMEFQTVRQLVGALKKMGVTNQHPERFNGLMGKRKWLKFVTAYEEEKTASGLLPLSYQLLWVYGRKER